MVVCTVRAGLVAAMERRRCERFMYVKDEFSAQKNAE